MNACIHRGWRWRRCRLLGAAALTAVVWLWGQPPALATNPVRPVEIVTPEEVAARDQIMPDTVEIRVREGEVRNLQAQLLLFRNGEQLLEQRLDPSFERAQPSDEVDESDGPVSVATIPAVPQAFLERVEPGIYAHKVQVTAEIQEGVPPLVVSEWVRWRTDGKQVELLTIERYSALTEQAEAAIGSGGQRTLVLRGGEIRLETPGEPQRDRFGTQVGSEGVVPERPVRLENQELRRSLDERDED